MVGVTGSIPVAPTIEANGISITLLGGMPAVSSLAETEQAAIHGHEVRPLFTRAAHSQQRSLCKLGDGTQ
jgi:hypothetical protein